MWLEQRNLKYAGVLGPTEGMRQSVKGLRKLTLQVVDLQVMRGRRKQGFPPSPITALSAHTGLVRSKKQELGRQIGVLFSGNIRATTIIPRPVFAHPLPLGSYKFYI